MENNLINNVNKTNQIDMIKQTSQFNSANIKKNKTVIILQKLVQQQEIQLIKQKLFQDSLNNYYKKDNEISLKDSLKYLIHTNGFENRIQNIIAECKKQTTNMIENDNNIKEEKPKNNMQKILLDKKVEWTNQLYDVLVDLSKNKEIKTKVIYDWNLFYQFLQKIQKEEKINKFMQEIRSPQIVRINYNTNIFQEIKEKYKYLRKNKHVDQEEQDSFIEQRELEFEEIIASEQLEIEQLREFLKAGCPNSKRVELYLNIFEIEDDQRKEVGNILSSLDSHSFAKFFDQIIQQDIQQSLRSELFFQFEQIILLVFKIFFKDTSISSSINCVIFDDVFSEEEKEKISINGIIPYKQMSLLIGPFCYSSQNEEIVYLLYREFFCRYFYKLLVISNQDEHIIGLCNIFEALLIQKDEDLLISMKNNDVKPLDIAFPWIFFCFVNHLEMEQQFFLFDRIVAFDSLKIVPVLAVAIIIQKRKEIKKLKRKQQILDLFQIIDHIIVIDTIREFLES